jgi:hypothetical protein
LEGHGGLLDTGAAGFALTTSLCHIDSSIGDAWRHRSAIEPLDNDARRALTVLGDRG